MSIGTYTKTFDGKQGKLLRKREVYLVFRNTRTGRSLEYMSDDKDVAMINAESIADEAAQAYGQGSTDVYKAKLEIISKHPIRPNKR